MPKLMAQDDTQIINVTGPGTFQFSAVRIEDLGATEYTLVTIVCDISGSVTRFADQLLECIKEIVGACKKSPRAENLLIRLLLFNDDIQEVHGFINLGDIDVNKYDPLNPQGMTTLFDATYDAIGATLEYSKRLVDQDFDCNGAVYIITDGMDNRSSMTPTSIKEKVEDAMSNEEIESLISILVSLHDPTSRMDSDVKKALERFKNNAGLTQFVDIGDATSGKLAKLANFVSESISSQSQSLGTGAPSQTLNF
jgi:uncharacterized protein YegL